MEHYVSKRILKVREGDVEEIDDPIAIEKRLRLSVNGEEILSLYCTPVMIKELIVGFIMTSEVIKGGWCFEKMVLSEGDEIKVDIPSDGELSMEGKVITSGCIGGITFEKKLEKRIKSENFRVTREELTEIFRKFQDISEPYKSTGCIHSAAISDKKEILAFADDIGRHNAVDKVIGRCIIEDIAFDDKVLLVSGRLSSEISSKCARWGIPVVASRTAPTLLSINLAQEQGVTMIGFLRGRRFNIYTHSERIIYSQV